MRPDRRPSLLHAVALLTLAALPGCGGAQRQCEADAVQVRGTCEARCQTERPPCLAECDRDYSDCIDPCADVPCRDACPSDRSDCVRA
jgi:hypothetical protein